MIDFQCWLLKSSPILHATDRIELLPQSQCSSNVLSSERTRTWVIRLTWTTANLCPLSSNIGCVLEHTSGYKAAWPISAHQRQSQRLVHKDFVRSSGTQTDNNIASVTMGLCHYLLVDRKLLTEMDQNRHGFQGTKRSEEWQCWGLFGIWYYLRSYFLEEKNTNFLLCYH